MLRSTATAELAAWLESRGAFVHPSLELFAERETGERGVFALQPIEEGELLLRLPRAAAMCVCEDGDDGAAWLPAEARAMSAVVRTSLCLMREHALGPASDWAPYLRLLPKSYDTLENWSQSELNLLRGTSVHAHLAGLRDGSGDLIGMARIVYDKQVGPVVRAHPQLWPDTSPDAFLDACAAVRTRGFHDTGSGGGGPYMLPAIDMLNHARAGTATSLVVERLFPPHDLEAAAASSCGSPVESILGSSATSPCTTAATAGSASEEPAEGAGVPPPASHLFWSMKADRRIAGDEEVTHSYDALDNAQLLLCYGFVAPDGEAPLPTSARMPLVELIEAAGRTVQATLHTAEWDVSEAWGEKEAACAALLAPYGGAVSVSTDDPLPDALMTVLQLMLMPAEDFRELLQEEEEAQGPIEGGHQSAGGAWGGAGWEAGSEPSRRRIPMLDASAVESEPAFASLVVGALLYAVDASLRHYATDAELGITAPGTGEPSRAGVGAAGGGQAGSAAAGPAVEAGAGSAAAERRRRMAAQLVLAEKAALRETRRRGVELMLTAERSEDTGEEGELEEGKLEPAEPKRARR